MTHEVGPVIRLRGVRHNNLKNFDLDLPIGRLIVVTGLRGSRKDAPRLIWEAIQRHAEKRGAEAPEVLVTFNLPLSEKLSLGESLTLIAKQGYQRLLWKDQILRLDEAADGLRRQTPASLTIVQ